MFWLVQKKKEKKTEVRPQPFHLKESRGLSKHGRGESETVTEFDVESLQGVIRT